MRSVRAVVPRVTRHHLVPQSRVRKRKRRGQKIRTMQNSGNCDDADALSIINVCPACHAMIHATFTEKELESSYHTRDSLLKHPEIARFVQWVRKQVPGRRVAVRWTRSRRDR